MKTMIFCFLLSLGTAITLLGQNTPADLKSEADFMTALMKMARYPRSAQQAGKVAKVYVNFSVETNGHIGNVNVLNENAVDPAFSVAVKQLMSKLPDQKPAYAGAYVLPIIFELEGQNGKTEQPKEGQPLDVPSGQTLLNELVVVAYK
ncbi:TonB family protein [Spirosoma sp. SC4-14]|uniref:TonB family protein n=1 Tax=Spirosoma sp. SC4-14 TaxID=3128900 RepID=UPI0030CF7FB5